MYITLKAHKVYKNSYKIVCVLENTKRLFVIGVFTYNSILEKHFMHVDFSALAFLINSGVKFHKDFKRALLHLRGDFSLYFFFIILLSNIQSRYLISDKIENNVDAGFVLGD